MLSSRTISISISLFLFALLLPSVAGASTEQRHRFSKIYAFGDSFTDTGNTHSTAGPYSFGYVSGPPYGATFFHRSTNRYSDGRLVVDFLADALSLPFLPPYLNRPADSSHGVNFAVAGSTAIEHDFYVKNNVTIDITPQSLMTQLLWFDNYLEEKGCKRRGSPECQAATSDALFWVGEIGVNDYAYSLTSTLSPDIIQRLALKNVNNFIEVCSDAHAHAPPTLHLCSRWKIFQFLSIIFPLLNRHWFSGVPSTLSFKVCL